MAAIRVTKNTYDYIVKQYGHNFIQNADPKKPAFQTFTNLMWQHIVNGVRKDIICFWAVETEGEYAKHYDYELIIVIANKSGFQRTNVFFDSEHGHRAVFENIAMGINEKIFKIEEDLSKYFVSLSMQLQPEYTEATKENCDFLISDHNSRTTVNLKVLSSAANTFISQYGVVNDRSIAIPIHTAKMLIALVDKHNEGTIKENRLIVYSNSKNLK